MKALLQTKIYKKYFPIKNSNIRFSENELEIILLWIRHFKVDLMELTIKTKKMGISFLPYFKIESKDLVVLEQKLVSCKKTEGNYLWLLNIIIYRHKYNAILSWFLFPLLTDRIMKKYFADEIQLLDVVK